MLGPSLKVFFPTGWQKNSAKAKPGLQGQEEVITGR
jgi:hypothetical protein